jgi:uncharacterized protein
LIKKQKRVNIVNIRRYTLNFRECCFKNIPINGKKLVWEITHSCDFHCDYCFQEKKRKNNPQRVLNTTDLIKICNILPKLGIVDVLITGGEIYKVKDILNQICKIIKEFRINLSFSTMYQRVDFINELLSYKPTAINFSFDPPDQLFSLNENKKRICDLIELCEYNNVDAKITGVITNKNNIYLDAYLKELDNIAKKYASLKSVYLTNPYEIGYSTVGLEMDRKQQKKIHKKIKSIIEEKDKFKLINFFGLNVNLQKCPAASSIIHLEPNGDIYPCHLLANFHKSHYLMGNILNTPIDEIEMNIKRFAEQIDIAIEECIKLTPECLKCGKNQICRCGCIAEILSKGKMIEPKLVCRYINNEYKETIDEQFNVLEFSEFEEDLTNDEKNKISDYVFSHIRKGQHDLAHGIDHTKCVVKLARHIAKKEKANLRIVTVAAYFHDFAPRRTLLFEGHTKISAEKARQYLNSINFSVTEINNICNCIDSSSYGSDELGFLPSSKEAEIVRDADWLDAIGSRGIARVFAFAAANNCETLGTVDYDIDNPPKLKMSLVGTDPTPIYHFFSKLLWVKDKLCTKTAKELGEERHRVLVNFLNNYKKEMEI